MKLTQLISVFVVIVAAASTTELCPKIGVIHIHGLFEGWREHTHLRQILGERYGVYTHLIGKYSYVASLTPIWHQVTDIRKEVQAIASKYDAVIGIGFSQGGVLWRGIIETWNDHNVHTLITLASPLMGLHHLPDLLFEKLPLIKAISSPMLYTYAYSPLGQLTGFLNYFNDRNHHDLYLKHASFLPDVNCERGSAETRMRYKTNFLKLRKMLVVGGPGEDVVDPWESTIFGYYSAGNYNHEVDMKDLEVYQKDLFGLKTLDERGGLERCVFPKIDHIDFRDNIEMLKKCVFPTLDKLIGNN